MNKWYEHTSDNSDVVMYSKINLSRNFANTLFPARMNDEQKKSVAKKIFVSIKNSPLGKEFDMYNLSQLAKAKSVSYAEKNLADKEFCTSNTSSYFIIDKDEDLSIMCNFEDHININSFAPGQNLIEAYNKANDIDDILIDNNKIAYKDNLGFLTSSPIKLGTGLKASLVLHLPALKHENLITRLASMISKLGLSLTPLYDNAKGDMYILSNQVTLGITEKSAMDNVNAVCDQIIIQERKARETLKQNPDLEDRIYRTLGILKLARRVSVDEFLDSISLIRLGISLNYFQYPYSLVGDMLYNLFDASLVDSSKSDLTKDMCDSLRAQIIREKLG